MFDAALEEQARALLEAYRGAGRKIATAESCTGGLIAGALTEIAGSSDVVERGFVTYSNAAKQDMLGVKPETLAEHGAVSEAVVSEMAHGAVARSAARVSVAISGVAGPGGGTAAKPVGLVCLAWALPDGAVHTRCLRCEGGREQIRREAVAQALAGLVDRLAASHGQP